MATRSSAIAEGPRGALCQLKFCQLYCTALRTSSSAVADKPARRAASRQTAKF